MYDELRKRGTSPPAPTLPSITRRDFLNGLALTIAAGVTPWEQIRAQPSRYPPALTGMRGHHPGSFEVAHEFARERRQFSFDQVPIEERYDLVVIGGGISGLAAAYFYRQARGNGARILIVDNHDDFGGHAKRNEFRVDGRLIIGYGGSESIQSPRSFWSGTARGLLHDLGVDVRRFETAFSRSFYGDLGLSRGIFFAREAFGRDVLVPGDPASAPGEGAAAPRPGENSRADLVAAFPVSDASKAQFIALYESMRDPLAGKSAKKRRELLERTSYRDFLIKHWGCSEEVANCFQGRTLGFFGLGADAVPAADVFALNFPGFQGLGLSRKEGAAYDEPYIYHFPDGNASLARLLVRALIPGIAPGSTMEDVVLAPFDYGKLDDAGNAVRIRLDSTCLNVRNAGNVVQVGYFRDGKLYRVEASHAVLACFHMVIPHLMPELPEPQRDALAHNVKAPLVYTNVVIRDWQPFARLKVHDITAPMSFHTRTKLDFPVDLGGYTHPRDPAGPICLHLTHVPGEPLQGLDARTQFRIGRQKLLEMTFADFEMKIREELDRMLGAGGFDSGRDIAAITVNRWSHGYGYVANTLFDPDDYHALQARAIEPAGRVTIANSDSGGDAYAHLAIDAAARAVRELSG
jgi:spermidine dehydrogenase